MGDPAHGEWADACGAWRAAAEGERRGHRHVFYPLVRRMPAISGGEPVDRQSACCHDGLAWQAHGDEPARGPACRPADG